jgi:energy-coupling factor transporter ATP-binding protein EcfA2
MYPSVHALRRDASRRLRRGEYLILHGPLGSGKTTLLAALEDQLKNAGVPCARAAATHSLGDIEHALERMSTSVVRPKERPQGTRQPRKMVTHAAIRVLLLDHLTDMSNAMVKSLRRLNRAAVGVVTAVDLEVEEEQRLGLWRLGGALAMRMPPVAAQQLHELLQTCRNKHHLRALTPEVESSLIRAARGRPGWILQCIDLELTGSYWRREQLRVSGLSEDTEAALRLRAMNLLQHGDFPGERT